MNESLISVARGRDTFGVCVWDETLRIIGQGIDFLVFVNNRGDEATTVYWKNL